MLPLIHAHITCTQRERERERERDNPLNTKPMNIMGEGPVRPT